MIETVLFIFYELCIMIFGVRVVLWFCSLNRLQERMGSSLGLIYLLSLGLAVSIVLNYLISFLLSEIGFVSKISYMVVIMSLIFLSIILKSERKVYSEIIDNILPIYNNFHYKHIVIVLSISVPFLFVTFINGIHQIIEVDSLHYINFIVDWSRNAGSPLTNFALGYVPFWELNFLPITVITSSVYNYWWIMLKSIVLLYLSVYLLARTIGLSNFYSLPIVASTLFLKPLWLEPSGFSTIKNDVIYGVGFMFLLLAILTFLNKLEDLGFLFLTMGITFSLVKYSGVFVVLLILFSLAILFRKQIIYFRLNNKTFMYFLIVCFGALMNGIYYLRNLLIYKNPLYPSMVYIGDIKILDGLWYLKGTSIIERIGDPQLYFILGQSLWRMGILFPVIFYISLFLPIIYLVILFLTKTKLDEKVTMVLLIISGGWFLYLTSYYSAGMTASDYQQIISPYFNSIRYVIGPIVSTEVMIYWLICKFVALDVSKQYIILLSCGIQFGSRFSELLDKIKYVNFYPIFLLVVFTLFAIIMSIYLTRKSILIYSLMIISLLFFSKNIYEVNSQKYFPQWENLRKYFYYHPSTNIALQERYSYWDTYYPFLGSRMQHNIKIHDFYEDSEKLSKFDYIIRIQEFGNPDYDSNKNFADFIQSKGFMLMELNDYYTLLVNPVYCEIHQTCSHE